MELELDIPPSQMHQRHAASAAADAQRHEGSHQAVLVPAFWHRGEHELEIEWHHGLRASLPVLLVLEQMPPLQIVPNALGQSLVVSRQGRAELATEPGVEMVQIRANEALN